MAEQSLAELKSLIQALRSQPPEERPRGNRVCLLDLDRCAAYVAPLVALLRDDAEPFFRIAAIHALPWHAPQDSSTWHQPIVDALSSDPDPTVRTAAAEVLGDIAQSAPMLIAALSDPSASVRSRALWSLARFRKDETVSGLFGDALRRDPDSDVRHTAARVIGDCKMAAAVPDLVGALADPDAQVRAAVFSALYECEAIDADPALLDLCLQGLADPSPWVREKCAHALRFGPPEAVPALLPLLEDESPAVRLEAVIALGNSKSPDAFNGLVRSLRDSEEDVRYYASGCLAELKDRRATPHLVSMLNNRAESIGIRRQALNALGENADLGALSSLCDALQDDNAELRQAAAEALGKLCEQSEEDKSRFSMRVPLCEALCDLDPDVRVTAAETLGQLGDPQAIPSLLEVRHDASPEVRAAVVEALSSLDDVGQMAVVLDALKDPENKVRRKAARALRFAPDEAPPPEALELLQDPDRMVRTAVAEALAIQGHDLACPALVAALNGNPARVCPDLMNVVGQMKDPRAFELFLALLSHPEDEIRGAAALGLAAIGDERAIAPLMTLQKDPSVYARRRVVRALGFFKPWDALPSSTRWLRRIARFLGRPVPPDVQPALVDSLQDESEHVVAQAVEALAALYSAESLRTLASGLPPGCEVAREALERESAAQENGESAWPRRVYMGTLHYE